MSFWYAATPSCDGRFSPVIGRADAALYEAKRGGRNRAAIEPDFPLEAAERRVVFEAAPAVSSRDPRSTIETEGRGPRALSRQDRYSELAMRVLYPHKDRACRSPAAYKGQVFTNPCRNEPGISFEKRDDRRT